MVEFKPSMKKEELLEVAAANGVAADDSMTKTQIIEALNAHNAKETAGKPAEGPRRAQRTPRAAKGAEIPAPARSPQNGPQRAKRTPEGAGPATAAENSPRRKPQRAQEATEPAAGVTIPLAEKSPQNGPQRARRDTTRSYIAGRPFPAGG